MPTVLQSKIKYLVKIHASYKNVSYKTKIPSESLKAIVAGRRPGKRQYFKIHNAYRRASYSKLRKTLSPRLSRIARSAHPYNIPKIAEDKKLLGRRQYEAIQSLARDRAKAPKKFDAYIEEMARYRDISVEDFYILLRKHRERWLRGKEDYRWWDYPTPKIPKKKVKVKKVKRILTWRKLPDYIKTLVKRHGNYKHVSSRLNISSKALKKMSSTGRTARKRFYRIRRERYVPPKRS